MSIAGYLRYYGGIILIVFGLFLTFGGIVRLNEGTETLGGFLSLVFFVGVLPVAAGVWMVYSAKKTAQDNLKKKHEKEILQLALKLGGYVTAAQVSVHTSLSSSVADDLLRTMQEQGVFVLKVSESGNIVYQIAGMLKDGEKLLDV